MFSTQGSLVGCCAASRLCLGQGVQPARPLHSLLPARPPSLSTSRSSSRSAGDEGESGSRAHIGGHSGVGITGLSSPTALSGNGLTGLGVDDESGLLAAVTGLRGEMRRVQGVVAKAKYNERLRGQAAAEEVEAAVHSRERSLALEAFVAKKQEEAEELRRQLAKATRAFADEEARGEAEKLARAKEHEESLYAAHAQAGKIEERHSQERMQFEARLVEQRRVGESHAALRVSNACAVAEAIDMSAQVALTAGLCDSTARWPTLLKEVANRLVSAVAGSLPRESSEPSKRAFEQGTVLANINSSASAMVEHLLALSVGSQNGAASATRVPELQVALREELARKTMLERSLQDSRYTSGRLISELLSVREQRYEAEKEQTDFLPFANQQLEQVVDRLAFTKTQLRGGHRAAAAVVSGRRQTCSAGVYKCKGRR